MFNCEICNYITVDKSNYVRHMQSKKHNNYVINNTNTNLNKQIILNNTNNTNTVSQNNIFKCSNCNKVYNYKNAYNNHVKYCVSICTNNTTISTPIINTDINSNPNNTNQTNNILMENKSLIMKNELLSNRNIEIENELKKLQQKLEIYEKENINKDAIIRDLYRIIDDKNIKLLEEKDNKIDIFYNENTYLKSVCNNATNFVAETMNTVNFIINNLTSAPPIDKNMDYKKIIYENKDKIDVLDEIVHHFRHKSLVKYIGNIIVKCYKKDDPKQQSIWNSDIARKNYLLREIINKKAEWITDKKGIKTTEIIIDPIIKILDKLIRDFLNDDKSINKDGTINKFILEKRLNIGIELNEILLLIDHKTLHNEVNSYIAQFFYFNKSEFINNTTTPKTIKKVGRPKTVKAMGKN